MRCLSTQFREQLLPTTCGGVSRRDAGHRARPGDRKVRIVVRHTDVLARIVGAVDPVADVSGGSKRLEAVQETRGNVEVPKRLVVEHERLAGAESWRIPADVDDDVVDGAMRTADELRLAETRSPVHAPDDADAGSGLRILNEDGGADAGLEDVDVERSSEESTVVAKRLRYQHQQAIEIGVFDAHQAMFARSAARKAQTQ